MSISSAELDPIRFANDWQFVTVSTTPSPGAIAVNGMHGFERETGWDKKKGKGTRGATLTLTNLPPCEGSIDFQLWLPEHFQEWGIFRQLLKYDPARRTASKADAFDIFHPALADIEMSQAVTHKIGPARHVGRGLYIITVTFIEWINPPAVSIVATTTSAKPNEKPPGTPPNPEIDRLQKEIAAAKAAADSTTAGF